MKNKKTIIIIGVILLIVLISVFGSSTKTQLTLGEYKGIEIEATETKVTNKDVEDAMMKSIAEKQEPVKVTKRDVKKGDITNINFIGKVDGVAFEGGSAENVELIIGSGTFIPGFEEQLIGMKIGKTKDIKVKFPDSYPNNPDLEGVEATFTVTLNSIHEKKTPEKITDAMIKEISTAHNSVKEYREFIRQGLIAEAEKNDQEVKENAIWPKIVDNTKISSLSSKKINYYQDLFQLNYEKTAQAYNVTLSEFITSYMGSNQEEFNKQKVESATKSTTDYAIAEEIAKIENITLSEKEYKDYISANELDSEQQKQYGESIKDELLYKKVIDFVLDNAKITIKEK